MDDGREVREWNRFASLIANVHNLLQFDEDAQPASYEQFHPYLCPEKPLIPKADLSILKSMVPGKGRK